MMNEDFPQVIINIYLSYGNHVTIWFIFAMESRIKQCLNIFVMACIFEELIKVIEPLGHKLHHEFSPLY